MDEKNPVLCISESCVDCILDLYHNSLFGAHQGSKNIFNNQAKVLYLMYHIRNFSKGCEIDQFHKVGPTCQRQFENKINFNYTSISKLSCDIKYIYRASTGHTFILVVTDEVTNCLLTVPLHRWTSPEVGEALINCLFCKHGPLYT